MLDQKRFLTLLPLIFLLLLLFIILALGILDRTDDECIGTQQYQDKGLNIAFNYSCEWNVKLNTNLTNSVKNIDNKPYPVLTNYSIKIIDKESNHITLEFITISTGSNTIELDQNYDIENFKDEIIRFKKKGTNIYRYSNKAECSSSKECVNSFINDTERNLKLLVTIDSKTDRLDEAEKILKQII